MVVGLALVAGAALLLAGCAKRPRVITPAEASREASLPPSFPSRERPGDQDRTLEHTIAPGETLARIAEAYYGDPQRWRDIAQDNGIRDPSRVIAGSTLVLRFSAAEWEQARWREVATDPYNRGVEALERGRLAEAEALFQEALAVTPDLAAARYNLALVWMKRGAYDKAEPALRVLAEERPRDGDILFAHGSVLFHQARFNEAAADFQRLLAIMPGHRQAAFSLARSLQEAGRRREAIAAWESYLRLDATSSWAETARRALRELRGG